MKIQRKLMRTILPLMLMIILTIPAFAADISFTDVSPDSPWIEGIQYAAEEGISIGTGNNCFSPDAPVTGRQWAVMVCRALDKNTEKYTETTFGEAEVRVGYEENWLGLYGMLEPDTRMSRGSLYESAFRVFGIPIYSFELYSEGKAMATRENCVRIAKELGICDEAGASNDIMTRGETVQLIYLLSTQEYQVTEPPILSELKIENPQGLDLNGYLLEVMKIPASIRTQFSERNWRFIVDCDAVAEFAEQLQMNCIGVCSYGDKAIFVAESSATDHEFGHFIHRMIGFPAEFEKLYETESKNTLPILREYSLTNSKEYFADFFRYWLENQDNDEKLDQIREAAPGTYAFFSHLATNGWKKSAR